MTGTYPEYLLLQKGIAPPRDPHATGVRVYADTGGALRSVQSDGTDAAIGGSGSTPVFARVTRSTQVAAWDGSNVQFNVVGYDPDSLWDAANYQFTATTAGWYSVRCFASQALGPVAVDTTGMAAGTGLSYEVVVFGAGDNVVVTQPVQVQAVAVVLAPLAGSVHLAVNDSIAIEGDGGSGWTVEAGATFELELIAAT